MQYAKLENGYLIPAPGEVRQGGMVIMNPGLEILGPMGYKPVEYTDLAEITTPGNDLREVYTEEADCIRVGWEEYTPDPEPQPDPEQLREMAYRAEADQHLMAYEGYLAEGKILEADEQKALYLAKKAEIRKRFPNNPAQ